ncbi:MAG TPA: hypothetical protein VFZ08_15850, partial [Terriglobia bacterium]|nr:hypothetical protein [Terriglobia bacterium]
QLPLIMSLSQYGAPTSTSCTGGPPNYCASSKQNIVAETPMSPPPVNTPFRDPDFGSHIVRVTDANTLSNLDGFGDFFNNVSYFSDSSAEANVWSKFDPAIGTSGGYRFAVLNQAGWTTFFTLDAATMHVSRLTGHPGGVLGKAGVFGSGTTFSYVNPDVFYTVQGMTLTSYNFTTDSESHLYNFAGCPGLPSYTSGYGGALTNSTDDQKFSLYFGGQQQNFTTLAVYYNRASGNCYWYDTAKGVVGGTGMAPTAVAGHVGQLAPPAAPVVAALPGIGSLPAGDYYVEVTGVTAMHPQNGETTPSKEVGPIHLSIPGSLAITFPTQLLNPAEIQPVGQGCRVTNLSTCRPFNVYIGTSRGDETLQNTGGPVSGLLYRQSRPLHVSSARAPATSTAGYNVHNARLSKSGAYLRVDAAEGYTLYYWKPGTNQVTACTLNVDSCGGHQALGYTHFVNDPDNTGMAEVLKRSFSTVSHATHLVNPMPTPIDWNASHWSWNDDNPSDTMPVCGSFYNSAQVGGDGTRNVLTNPVLRIAAPYDREIVCVATSGTPKVWRFAHTRATGASNANAWVTSSFWAEPRGNVSQDGKFYLFTSDWEWRLGNPKGSWGCPNSGTCRTDVFVVALH